MAGEAMISSGLIVDWEAGGRDLVNRCGCGCHSRATAATKGRRCGKATGPRQVAWPALLLPLHVSHLQPAECTCESPLRPGHRCLQGGWVFHPAPMRTALAVWYLIEAAQVAFLATELQTSDSSHHCHRFSVEGRLPSDLARALGAVVQPVFAWTRGSDYGPNPVALPMQR
jgi:hypothetical protein